MFSRSMLAAKRLTQQFYYNDNQVKDISMNTNTTLRLVAVAVLLAVASLQTAMAQESLSKEKPKPKPAPEPPKPAMVEKRTMSLGLVALYAPMVGNAVESGFRFPTIPSCCPGYEGTSGSGIAIGAELMIPISTGLELGARAAFQTSSADFTAKEPITVRVGNSAVTSSIDHSLATSVAALFVEPTLNYEIAKGFYLSGGLRLGTIMSATYEQSEKLADPSLPYDFSSGSGVWNNTSGDIPNKSGFQLGAVIGLRTAIALGTSLTVMPEVSYAPMFTSVVSDASWTASPLRVGASFLINMTKLEAVSTPIAP